VEIKCPLDTTEVFIVSGAVVFKLLIWCTAEGCVSGLQDSEASCKPDTYPNTTGSSHCIKTLEFLMMGIVVPKTC